MAAATRRAATKSFATLRVVRIANLSAIFFVSFISRMFVLIEPLLLASISSVEPGYRPLRTKALTGKKGGWSVAAPTPDSVKLYLEPYLRSPALAFLTVASITGSWPGVYGFEVYSRSWRLFRISQAVFVNVPVAVVGTTISTEAEPPAGRSPSSQKTLWALAA